MNLEVEYRNGTAPKKPTDFHCEAVANTAHALNPVWDFVKLGIEEIIRKAHGFCLFRPEDVYVTLRAGRGNLWMVYWGGKLCGFGITQVVNNPELNQRPYLLAWLGFCAEAAAVDGYFRFLEQVVAPGAKLREIKLFSTRHGWLKRKPGPKWEVLTRSGWVKDVTPEIYWGLYHAPEIALRVVL